VKPLFTTTFFPNKFYIREKQIGEKLNLF
jgi:hypothetical protein